MYCPGICVITENETFWHNLRASMPGKKGDLSLVTPGSDFARLFPNRAWRIVIVGPASTESDELETVKRLRSLDRQVPIILVPRFSSEQMAIAALRANVNDYLSYPVAAGELMASILRLSAAEPKREDRQRTAEDCPAPWRGIVGGSESAGEIRNYIARVAQINSHVLITGETGTGKELAAELVHDLGPRSGKPFVCINCAALPDSLLESELFGYEKGAFTGADVAYAGKLKLGDGGTVFFDEIGDMSPFAQAKILRLIETKEVQSLGRRTSLPVDIRIVSATNRDLESMVDQGTFRKDLYFRLNVVRIHLPPLRERKADISALLAHYLAIFNQCLGRRAKGFTDETTRLLVNYSWPGNVRELKNLLEASLIDFAGGELGIQDLPPQFRARLVAITGSQDERKQLLSILFSTDWNKSRAAKKLNWSRMTLYRKMARYQIPSVLEGRLNPIEASKP